jgi:hypothetical protein
MEGVLMDSVLVPRSRVTMWLVVGFVLTLCASAIIFNTWTADAAPSGQSARYFAITPTRAYDSRQGSYQESGLLGPNQSKTISIKDGHDVAGVKQLPDVVPVGATSVTYNLTIANPTGPNFVSVTPGDATDYKASAINFDGSTGIANGANVQIDANRQIKIWGGTNTGSMHIIIDITGYFMPAGT